MISNAINERTPELNFDIYTDDRLQGDIHDALKTLHRDAPNIFWTPDNGGHWVITRFELMEEVLKDWSRFSSRVIRVPAIDDNLILIPINLDPPDHSYFRKILTRHFGPAAIRRMEPKVRGWAQRLIGDVAGQGQCDFVDAVGTVFPVSVFMELMGLPLERLREYRALVLEYFENIPDTRRIALENAINTEMRLVLEARKTMPREDLASMLLTEEVDGRRMTMEELEALCNLMFQAGMDTVANFAAFFFLYLESIPNCRR